MSLNLTRDDLIRTDNFIGGRWCAADTGALLEVTDPADDSRITQVQDTFGVAYARVLAGAVMAGLPVALAYLLFQRRVTQAITLSAGIKG